MRTNFFAVLCISSIFFFLFIGSAHAGAEIEWEAAFGGYSMDEAFSVQQTSDSGYIVAGLTTSFENGGDVYLIKTNSNGIATWEKTFGGSYYDYAHCVQQTADDGYIVVGSTSSFGNGNYDVYLLKIDASGNLLWSKTFGTISGDYGEAVRQTNDNGYIIAGYTYSYPYPSHPYIIKTDSNGNPIWEKTYGVAGVTEEVYSIRQTQDGGYIAAGGTTSGSGNWDVYLIKIDSIGNFKWEKTFRISGSIINKGYSVQETAEGGYIITGETKSSGSQTGDVYLIKTDVNGNLIWEKTFGHLNSNDRGNSVYITSDGGYIIAGWVQGGDDVYLIKTDADGNEIWEKIFGGIGTDFGRSVQQTSDGGYIIAGGTDSFGSGFRDMYLIKLHESVTPDLKANGSDEPITIFSSERILLNASLSPGNHTSEIADYWVYANTPFGNYYYRPIGGWKKGTNLTYQGPLRELAPMTLLDRTGLPKGTYTIHFDIDLTPNGINEATYTDSVGVTVQ